MRKRKQEEDEEKGFWNTRAEKGKEKTSVKKISDSEGRKKIPTKWSMVWKKGGRGDSLRLSQCRS